MRVLLDKQIAYWRTFEFARAIGAAPTLIEQGGQRAFKPSSLALY